MSTRPTVLPVFAFIAKRLGERRSLVSAFYWDATGGFTFKTVEGDVPIEIVASLIAETKETIKVR